MVGRICSTNPKFASHQRLALEIVGRADELRDEFLHARERDEAAFDRVVSASAMPKSTEAEKSLRRHTLETALHHAAAEPLACAELSLEVLRLAAAMLEIPNRNLASDLGCAGEFGLAALNACAYNVRINHRFMHDVDAIEAQRNMLVRYEREANALAAAIRRGVASLLEK